jgi:WD40 repeat protein
LINGTFLRTSIDEYLTANGISAETLLTVEYVRAILPPSYVASFQHDDWISSVDVLSGSSTAGRYGENGTTVASGQERILTASYDGLLRVWNMSSNVLGTSSSSGQGGHTGSIKAAKFISPTQIASSGMDRTVRVWKYDEDEPNYNASITPQIELYGHKAAVGSIAVHAPSARILSASDDHSVGVWSSKKSDAPVAPANLLPQARSSKRRKLSSSTSTPQRGPLALMIAHSQPVSDVIFDSKDSTVAYSCSWDHTMRTWDLPTQSLVDTRTTSHSLLSITQLPDLHLIAVGTSARHITLIDPRASAINISAMTLRGHSNAVVSLARDPDSAYGLLSGSHDGTCRIWDVRSSRNEADGVVGESSYTIQRESLKGEGKRVGGEGVKVFGVGWDREVGIVSGGEDKQLQINRGKDLVGGTTSS